MLNTCKAMFVKCHMSAIHQSWQDAGHTNML